MFCIILLNIEFKILNFYLLFIVYTFLIKLDDFVSKMHFNSNYLTNRYLELNTLYLRNNYYINFVFTLKITSEYLTFLIRYYRYYFLTIFIYF